MANVKITELEEIVTIDNADILPIVDTSEDETKKIDIEKIFNLIFPVGKVETFFDNNDHSNYLGFTWERTCIGRTPVGIDSNDTLFDTIGETGGEKTHTLTIDEMPSHTHAPNSMATTFSGTGTWSPQQTSGDKVWEYLSIGNTGGGQAHNNLQPYQVIAFWKRTA